METKRDKVLFGVKIGEHRFDPENAINELKERIVDRGCTIAYIRPQTLSISYEPEDYIKWAKYLADNKIYFHFGACSQNPPEGKKSKISLETNEKIKEIAGEYYLGNAVREPGTHYGAKGPGYFTKGRGQEAAMPQKQDAADMKEAHEEYYRIVKAYTSADKETGMPASLAVEATALTKYNLEAGVEIPIIEVMNGNPDEMIPTIRGAARAYGKKWGSLIAHEWYGGMRHDDMLKRKRLDLISKYLYISGAGTLMLESGDEGIHSYGHEYGADSELCGEYRQALENIKNLIENDERPVGGPKTKFGFIFGLHDGWTGFCQSSVWNQFYRKEWGHNSAEYSWRILDSLGTKRKWGDVINYGEFDTSSAPAYGTYDIVPIEADVETLSKYEHLVFLGYNTMTDENMDKLTEYVRRGGKLLLSGAHLNYSTKREGEYIPPSNEKLEALCGCRYTGETWLTNFGTKFEYDSLTGTHLYPGTKTFFCDPLYSAGYTEYMKIELTSARELGGASDSFWSDPLIAPTVIENKVGEGVVTLVTSIDYPGAGALYPLYSALVREAVSSSARECEIKVIASDKLRYTVYEGNKIYLLNTDYDLPISIKILYRGKETSLMLDSLEMKTVTLE